MLDIYKYEQPILYNILNNSIINNKLSHAYLFDSNGNSDVYDIVLSFTKMIITSNITNETEKNNICMRIDDENYVNQLSIYKSFIENKTKKETETYLYSILNDTLKKI